MHLKRASTCCANNKQRPNNRGRSKKNAPKEIAKHQAWTAAMVRVNVNSQVENKMFISLPFPLQKLKAAIF